MERRKKELHVRIDERRKNGQYRSDRFMSPSPGWVLPEKELIEDSGDGDQRDCADSGDENEAMTGGDDDVPVGETVAAPGRSDADGTLQAAVVRNEPKAESDVQTGMSDDNRSVVRNEPKVESDVERVRCNESETVARNEPKIGREAELRAPYGEEALQNEASAVGGLSRKEGDRFGGSVSFDKIMAGTMRNLERPLPTIRLGISPGFGDGNSGGGSRRERRRRKAQARGRAK